MMNGNEKLKRGAALVWDYRVEAQEVLDVLEGRRASVAGLDSDALFRRMLQGMAWHVIVEMMGIEEVKRRLTVENIGLLWPVGLRGRYERVRKILRGEFVSPARWGTPEARKYKFPILSNRWYGAGARTHQASIAGIKISSEKGGYRAANRNRSFRN